MLYAPRFYTWPADPKREEGCSPFINAAHRQAWREHNCRRCNRGHCTLKKHLILADVYGDEMPLRIGERLGRTTIAGDYVTPCPEIDDTPLIPSTRYDAETV